MKCENCNHKNMMCVDDALFEGGIGFNTYMCPVCLTECYTEVSNGKIVTKKWTYKDQYLIRTKALVKETYRNFQTVKNGGIINAG